MKTAIDNNGIETEVSNDTAVKTIDGVHYLLTPEDKAEIATKEVEWKAGETQRINDVAIANRKAAYKSESDSLFFKVQRGEILKDEWFNKIEEIKNRFPKVQ